MKTYDPNIFDGVHVIETIIQSWEYKGRIVTVMGGNCFGKTILDFDFEVEEDDLKNDCNLQYDEDYDFWTAELHDKDGNMMTVEESSERFNDMIVKNEIIGHFETRDKANKFVEGLGI